MKHTPFSSRALALLALAAFFCLAACSDASDTYIVNNIVQKNSEEKIYPVQAAELNEKITPLRFYDSSKYEVVEEQVPLGFKSGNDDIPYMIFDSAAAKKMLGQNYSVSTVTEATKKVEVTNALTNAKAVVDLERRKIVFDNYDAFFQLKPDSVYADIAGIGANIDWLKMTSYGSIAGKPLTVYWGGSPNIEIVIWRLKDECALAFPLQTFCDIFCAPFFPLSTTTEPIYTTTSTTTKSRKNITAPRRQEKEASFWRIFATTSCALTLTSTTA